MENEIQQKCIKDLKGPCLVLAGPGTGKTFTISERVKFMVESGIDPEEILCLTFSDTGAKHMKEKINEKLNTPDCGVSIYTFHGFCSEIIKSRPDIFGLDKNIRLVSDAAKKEFLKECIDIKKTPNYIGSKKRMYSCIKDIQTGINAIKQNRLTKEKFFYNLKNNQEWLPELKRLREEEKELKSLHEKKARGEKTGKKGNLKSLENMASEIEAQKKAVKKMSELYYIYELFDKKMLEANYIDFSDMINLVLDAFETDKAFLNEIASSYKYIIADEYQDTNYAQNRILIELANAAEEKNIFVVGDDDQIIFTFQGARLDTMEKFLKEYRNFGVKVYCLPYNYRSTQNILDVSRVQIQTQLDIKKNGKVIGKEIDDTRLETKKEFEIYNISKELKATGENTAELDIPVEFREYDDENEEREDIVNQIVQLTKKKDENDTPVYSDIAVLAVNNAELKIYSQLLKEKNIPTQLKDGKNIFEIPSVYVIYGFMSALVNPELYSDRLYKIMFLPPFQIDPVDYGKICTDKKGKNFITHLKSVIRTEKFNNKKSLENFIKCYDYLTDYISKEDVRNSVIEIGAKTGIFDFYFNGDEKRKQNINQTENILGIKKLVEEATDFQSIKKGVSLKDFVDYLDMFIEDDELEIRTEKPSETYNAVQLSTYHGSKGKEFKIVFMPALTVSKWENNNFINTAKPTVPLDPEEAKTEEEYKKLKHSNARKLMYVGMTRAIETLKLSTCNSLKRSKFLSEDLLKLCLRPKKETENKTSCEGYTEKPDYDYLRDFKELIKERIKKIKSFSPSSINKYLKCPRSYLFDSVLGLRSKSGSPDALSFGESVHRAFQDAVDYSKTHNGEFPEEKEVIRYFTDDFKNRPISDPKERAFFNERGSNAIKNFYSKFKETVQNKKDIQSEIKIVRIYDGIKFEGKIDRLDLNKDETYSICDYKTGVEKSKMITLGGKYESYYNQILFYAYMLENKGSELNEEDKEFDLEAKKVKETYFVFPEAEKEKRIFRLTDDIERKKAQEQFEEVKNRFIAAAKNILMYVDDTKNAPGFDVSENKSKEYCSTCKHRYYCDIEKDVYETKPLH